MLYPLLYILNIDGLRSICYLIAQGAVLWTLGFALVPKSTTVILESFGDVIEMIGGGWLKQ